MKAVYRVTIIESEKGWGQKYFDHEDFPTKKRADNYVKKYNSKNTGDVPEWYTFAQSPRLIDLEA